MSKTTTVEQMRIGRAELERLRTLLRRPDRPLIWTDDDLEDAEARGEVDFLRHRTAGTYALSCNWRTGLTMANVDQIEAFIDRQEALAA